MNTVLIIIVLIIIVGGGIWYVTRNSGAQPAPQQQGLQLNVGSTPAPAQPQQ